MFASNNYTRVKERLRQIRERRARIDAIMARRRERRFPRNQLLTLNMITREAVRLWTNANRYLEATEDGYDEAWAGAKIGSSFRIRLPNDPLEKPDEAVPPALPARRGAHLRIVEDVDPHP